MATNPFEDMPVPMGTDDLATYDEAVLRKRMEPSGFWGTEIAIAGQKVRQALKTTGRGLTEDDRRAMLADQVYKAAGQTYARLVSEGQMGADEARLNVMEQTMREFMAAGDFKGAQSFIPQIEALRKAQLERRKLTSEIEFNETAKTELTLARAEKERAGATNLGAKTETEEVTRDPKVRKIESEIRKNDRWVPSTGGGTGPGATKIPGSKQYDFSNQVAGALGLVEKAGRLAGLLAARPSLGGDPAKVIGWMNEQIKGLGLGSGFSLEGLSEEEKAVVARSAVDVARGAKSFGVDYGQFQSVVMDMAYALARARDTGRLSDADVKNALKILGSSGDGQAAVLVLRNVVHDTVKDVIRRGNDFPQLAALPSFAELQDVAAKFEGVVPAESTAVSTPGVRGTAPGAVGAPPAGAAPAAPGGRKESAAERFRRHKQGG